MGKIQSCNITFFMLCFGMHENSSGCEMQCELFHFYTVQFFVQVRRLALIILFSEKLLFFDDYFFYPKIGYWLLVCATSEDQVLQVTYS